MSRLEITVGPADANVTDSDHLALQSAVDYVAACGGGAGRSPDRCVVEGNLVEDSGLKGDGVAVDLTGVVEDLVIRGNRLIDTRPATA